MDRGGWISPIISDDIARSGLVIESNLSVSGGYIYCVERRSGSAHECLTRISIETFFQDDLTPVGIGVQSKVHEYGGKAFVVLEDEGCIFVESKTQNLVLVKGRHVRTIFYSGGSTESVRFGEPVWDSLRRRILVVAEVHSSELLEPCNQLWYISLSGDSFVAVEGADFYASATFNCDGRLCAWLEWDHPDMAWDSARLMQAEITKSGRFDNIRKIAGGGGRSCFQPEYDDDDNLFYVCDDERGFWQLHRFSQDRNITCFPLIENDSPVECGLPLWQLGMRSYDFLDAGRIVLCGQNHGEHGLYVLDIESGQWTNIALAQPFCNIQALTCADGRAYFLSATRTETPMLIEMDFTHDEPKGRVIKKTMAQEIDEGYISLGKAFNYESGDGERAYGFYYAPKNKDVIVDENYKPPLIVRCHGGPSANTNQAFNIKIQFWTSRGFAVCDLNYRGSTGFGRAYRESLYQHWGIRDCEDCVGAARYLVEEGLADGEKLIIAGSSAGGFSALATITQCDDFSAATSAYGISDLSMLLQDTHKFESHYLIRLIAPYSDELTEYKERSPLYNADKIRCSVLFLQGEKDKVVPPNQMTEMIKQLRLNNVATRSILFPNEGHGFREPDNIALALDAELKFYEDVLDLQQA